jgi:hypothetical protein
MELLDIIAAGQGGALITRLGAAAGVDAATARAALDKLAPEIARRIAAKAQDPDEYEHLLDVLEEGEADAYLDSPRALLSRAAAQDGEDILAHLYGSLDAARREAGRIGAPDGMTPAIFERFMSYAAAVVLAAMTRRNKALAMPAASQSAAAQGGIMAMLIDAIVKGVVDGFKKAMVPRRRRTSSTYGRKRKSATTTARKPRTRSPSLQDILGDIVKDAVKLKSR